MASNFVFHERTQYSEMEFHFIKEKLVFGDITTRFVNSRKQLVDILTKFLKGPMITYICKKPSIYNLYAPT